MTAATTRFDRFVVEGRLGVGGMGEVFRARDGHGPVALKLMRPEMAVDEHYRRLFLAEARLGARLDHPNLVRQLDYGERQGALWLALELVDGVSLDRILKLGPLSPAAAAVVASSLLAALDYVHARGLVHRDVSASNVLVSRAGEVKLSDFGVAKMHDAGLTRTNDEKGKPAYMAPEILRHEGARLALDGRADLFSVGVLAFRMTMGAPPFREVADWLRAGAPLSPVGPLAGWIARAMAPDREARFADARAMAAALAQLVPAHADGVAELRARAGHYVQATAPVGDLDRLVIAALSDGAAGERTRPAANDVISGEVGIAIAPEPSTSRARASRALSSLGRRWLPLAAVAAVAAVGLVVPRRHRAEVAPAATARPPLEARAATEAPAPIEPPVALTVAPAPRPLRAASTRTRKPAAPPLGYLTLDTRPWGVVYLDGRRLGITPFAHVPVPSGRHRLSVDVEESGRRRSLTVDVRARGETQLVAPLR
jgi:hypothetical protein